MDFKQVIRKIRDIDKGKLNIIKSGIFYYAYNRDAEVLGRNFNLKRNCFCTGYCKVGFPLSSLYKYLRLLEVNNINYVVYEDNKDFLNDITFDVNGKIYGKTKEYIGSNDLENIIFLRDCVNCKNYESEIQKNKVSSYSYNIINL